MFRLWGKEFKDNRLLKDIVIEEDDPSKSRTAKVFHAVTEICMAFDLAEPIWLDSNIKEFQRRDKTRFTQDNFIESIEFDYLEIHVIEE
ncbi:hypothetical protein HNP82_002035 [Catenibacillus scindens]|uniref:Uncharacterized protein n=1 Tax=Catenibacillus scindens TaxID=673271 RepID=A0A7W8M600_9FIRM|nr:hypothetical protein [Catenibacillus scindens]MBB5264896.1 hypothetical protein [Catenibacillus scindens]